jgi:uncharacterized protein involved in exopolysaccharide biosynthesis
VPLVAPIRYTSSWTFILPAANSGATVALETIGQTSTNPGQPFASVSISPKAIYKEILRSEQVRRAAAEALQMSISALPRPRVKLIDETSLLICDIDGPTPDEAQRRARAYLAAFNAQLDVLRRDEVERRAQSVRASLGSYQTKLDAARVRILAAQEETGVVSINQFNEAQTSIELIRRRLAEQQSDLQKLEAEQTQMRERLGLRPEIAAISLRLVADPAFAKLAAEFGDAHAEVVQTSARLGALNPVLMAAEQKRSSSLRQLRELAADRFGRDSSEIDQLALVVNNSHQAELLRAMVALDAQIEGRRTEIAALETGLQARRDEMRQMTASSARLEDLKKDHLVAEAVFTSAVARLDTNRTDVFASYPMVQVLAEPDLPDRTAHPVALYAVLAGLVGTMMILLAWGLAWLRPTLARSQPMSA